MDYRFSEPAQKDELERYPWQGIETPYMQQRKKHAKTDESQRVTCVVTHIRLAETNVVAGVKSETVRAYQFFDGRFVSR